jgi:hypothetical protein
LGFGVLLLTSDLTIHRCEDIDYKSFSDLRSDLRLNKSFSVINLIALIASCVYWEGLPACLPS